MYTYSIQAGSIQAMSFLVMPRRKLLKSIIIFTVIVRV